MKCQLYEKCQLCILKNSDLVLSYFYSLIQLLDYPLVFVDLAKHSKENTDHDNEDDESISEEKCSLTVMEYRTIALEIMVCL